VPRPRLLAIALVAIVGAGAGIYLVSATLLRGDDVAPLALPSPSAVVASATAPPGVTSPEPAASASLEPTGSTVPGSGDGDLAGTWTAVEGSTAGYRVLELLAGQPAETEAVGRTSDVSGSIAIVDSADALQLTEGAITVDTTTIVSDEGRRDNRMRTEGLQTDAFPTATFVLSGPIDVPAAARDGAQVEVTLIGDLTLHGVTRSVEIPAQAQFADGRISVLGSLRFALADFDIVAPNVGGFIISIADEGTLEFLLVLARA
jgi:polyisoprenoid-binding protein YceI